MNKKLVVILIVAASVILTAIFCIFFIHPRMALYTQTLLVYDSMGGTTDIGEPIMAYEQYDVTDDTLTMVNYGDFSVGIPSDWIKEERDNDVFTIYIPQGTPEGSVIHEAITSTGNGTDYSDMVLLNRELYDPKDLNTEYLILLSIKDKDTAYAIINSLEFND